MSKIRITIRMDTPPYPPLNPSTPSGPASTLGEMEVAYPSATRQGPVRDPSGGHQEGRKTGGAIQRRSPVRNFQDPRLSIKSGKSRDYEWIRITIRMTAPQKPFTLKAVPFTLPCTLNINSDQCLQATCHPSTPFTPWVPPLSPRPRRLLWQGFSLTGP